MRRVADGDAAGVLRSPQTDTTAHAPDPERTFSRTLAQFVDAAPIKGEPGRRWRGPDD